LAQAQAQAQGWEPAQEKGSVPAPERGPVRVLEPGSVRARRSRVRCHQSLHHHRLSTQQSSRDKEVGSVWWVSAAS